MVVGPFFQIENLRKSLLKRHSVTLATALLIFSTSSPYICGAYIFHITVVKPLAARGRPPSPPPFYRCSCAFVMVGAGVVNK